MKDSKIRIEFPPEIDGRKFLEDFLLENPKYKDFIKLIEFKDRNGNLIEKDSVLINVNTGEKIFINEDFDFINSQGEKVEFVSQNDCYKELEIIYDNK